MTRKPPPAVYEPPPPPPPPVTTKPSFSAPPAEKQYAQLIARLRDALKKRGAAGIQGLARNFRICDVDKSKELDRDELSKCLRLCKLDATDDDLELLFGHFDRSGDGQIDYEEFLKAVRGPLTGVRKKIVVAAFHKIDEYSGGTAEGRKDGVLTIDDIKGVYCTKEHPEVKAGRATGDSVLREFLQKFEGLYGNRDGKVSLKEWLDYYNDLSEVVRLGRPLLHDGAALVGRPQADVRRGEGGEGAREEPEGLDLRQVEARPGEADAREEVQGL